MVRFALLPQYLRAGQLHASAIDEVHLPHLSQTATTARTAGCGSQSPQLQPPSAQLRETHPACSSPACKHPHARASKSARPSLEHSKRSCRSRRRLLPWSHRSVERRTQHQEGTVMRASQRGRAHWHCPWSRSTMLRRDRLRRPALNSRLDTYMRTRSTAGMRNCALALRTLVS